VTAYVDTSYIEGTPNIQHMSLSETFG